MNQAQRVSFPLAWPVDGPLAQRRPWSKTSRSAAHQKAGAAAPISGTWWALLPGPSFGVDAVPQPYGER